MTTPRNNDLTKQLQQLPVADRLSILICAAVEANPKAYSGVHAVLQVAVIMAEYLNNHDRKQLSCVMRDLADRLEQPLVVHTN